MNRTNLLECLCLIVLVAVATAWFWPELPARVPVHWNLAGQADGYGPRAFAWLTGPGLMAAVLALGVALPWLSPRRFDVRRFSATYAYLITVVVTMLGFIQLATLAAITTGQLSMARVVPAAVCILLMLIGSPMGKVRRNFFIGVRTPWTLASERVWYATHRFAGWSMVGGGLLGLLAVLAGAPHWLALALILVCTLAPVPYSLFFYKRLERLHQLEPE